jgi:hypothetical protein
VALEQRRIERRLGWLAVFGGLALALAVQVAEPVGVPLFDGVVVHEPYRYLRPGPGQAGSPTSFTATPGVTGGVSPIFVAATGENPPQAQLNAKRGAFDVPAGTTSLTVSITPIEPPAPPPGRLIAGNVYRFSVVDQDGAPVPIQAACDTCVTLLLRGTDTIGEAALARYDGAAWVAVETLPAGAGGRFQANPTVLGEDAGVEVVAPARGADLVLIGAAGALALLLAGMGFLLFRVRPAAAESPEVSSTRMPSKRRRRRPPGGGQDP